MPETGPSNPNPLHEKYPELHTSEPVELAVNRHQEQTGETIHQPAEKIDEWMNTLERIHIGRDEATAQRIKDVYHRQFVMRPNQVPESYFELQRRIAREQGHGDVVIPEQVRREMSEVISRDQERSLDSWIDYLSSTDAAYPMWFKYYTFRNVVKLADFDKSKGEFKKRSKSTTSPFPDINREALGYMADALASQYHITSRNQDGTPTEIDPQTKVLLDQDANFAKLYAHAIEKIHPATAEELAVTDGQWIKYPRGSDGKRLAQTLQGHGTGWCTAGEGTAQDQLDNGDFYVYYTKNPDGQYIVPRVAIRMEEDEIGEVRGIQADQNLEPVLVDIARTKMAELPGAKEYEKKARDMAQLTDIEHKMKADQELTSEELWFLHEINGEINGFGYEADPRINELKSNRDWMSDMSKIFMLPMGSETAITNRLIDIEQGFILVQNLDKFHNIDQGELFDRLVQLGYGDYVARYNEKFDKLEESDIANRLLNAGLVTNLEHQLYYFYYLDESIADRLIALKDGDIVAVHADSFDHIYHRSIANKLIDAGFAKSVASTLYSYSNLDANIAFRLIEAGYRHHVVTSKDRFSGLDTEGARRLIDNGHIAYVVEYLNIFTGLDASIAKTLINAGYGKAIALYLDEFVGIPPAIIAEIRRRARN